MKFRKSLTDNGNAAPDVESPRRLTRDLLRAFELAVMLTHSRASETIEVADLAGGDVYRKLGTYEAVLA